MNSDLKFALQDSSSLRRKRTNAAEGSVKFADDVVKDTTEISRHVSVSVKSNKTSMHVDAAEYYRNYDNADDCGDIESQSMATKVVGECYLNFSKLLQSEMRHLDKRDSSILQSKMSLNTKKSSTRLKDRSFSGKRKFEFSAHSKRGKHLSGSENKAFKEQVWHMGKVIGQVKGVFQLSNVPTVQ